MKPVDVPAITVILLGLTAVVFDVRTRRIPNVLTLGGAAAALVYAAQAGGLAGVGAALGGWFLGAALFFPFFALGGMGAGDVKLIAAFGAWLGPADTVPLAIFASIAGGVFARGRVAGDGLFPPGDVQPRADGGAVARDRIQAGTGTDAR